MQGFRKSAGTAWELLKQTGSDWTDDRCSSFAAALAFYTALSIAPMLVIIIAVAGLAFGAEAAQGAIMEQMSGLVGHHSAATIESMIKSANQPKTGILATIFGIVVLLFGATGVFAELQDSMNAIWRVKPKPGTGLKSLIRQRFLSLAMVAGCAFLLLVSLVVNAVMSALGTKLHGFLPGLPILWQVLSFATSFAVIALLFGGIFKVLPDVKIPFRDVWIGAVATAALFILGKVLLGVYIAEANLASTYGAAGSVVVLLLWIYYSAQIFFFGAEFTQAFAYKHGSRIEAKKNAVVTREDRTHAAANSGEKAEGKTPAAPRVRTA